MNKLWLTIILPLLWLNLPLASPEQETSAQPKIAVIGAGLSGMTAAYRLKNNYNLKCEVFEVTERVGGRVWTKDFPQKNLKIEMGASFINSDHHAIIQLCKELEITIQNIEPKKSYSLPIVLNGKKYTRRQLFHLFQNTLVQIHNDGEKLWEEEDQEQTPLTNRLNKISIQEYLDQLQASPLLCSLLNIAHQSEYGADISEITALTLFEMLTIDLNNEHFHESGGLGDEAWKVVGGNSLIPQNLQKKAQQTIHFHHQLTTIESQNNQLLLTFQKGQEQIKKIFDYVIVTVPLPIIHQDIQINIDSFPQQINKAMRFLKYGRNAKILMFFEERKWSPLTKGEILFYHSDQFEIWESSYPQNGKEHCLTIYLGGSKADKNYQKDLPQLTQDVLQDLSNIIPNIHESYVETQAAHHWPSYIWTKGSYSGVYGPGQWDYSDWLLNPKVGNLVFAGEQWSEEYAGFMNGAVATGNQAAKQVAKQIIHKK